MRALLGQQRFVYPLLGLVCLAVSLVLGWSAYGNRINHVFYDLYFRQRGPQPISSDIVIVGIDDATLAEYGPLPLDRTRLAEGIEILRSARPQLIAIDVFLTDPGNPEEDKALEHALAGTSPGDFLEPVAASLPPIVLGTGMDAGGAGRWLAPREGFARSAAAIAHVHADPDGDGVSRQVLLERQGDRQRYWAFALECYRLLLGARSQPFTETDEGLEIDTAGGRVQIPARRANRRALLINYAGGDATFPRVSFSSLGRDPAAAARLRDKIVLLGATAQATGDRLFTPFSAGIGMAGVEIHANILNTLVRGNYLLPVSDSTVLLGMAATVLATLWGIARLQGIVQTIWLIGVAVVVLAAPYARFVESEVWPAFSLLGAFGTTLIAGETYQLLVVRRRYQESEAKRRMSQQRFEMAAHEMRTPLASIQASSELLARYSLENPRREQMMQLLYEESQRLGRLVERFLSVERLSAGEMELRRAEVDLPRCLSTVCERLQPLADRKEVRLELVETGEAVEIEADPELLEFAVSNLITNAVKYSPAGTTVRIAWERDEQTARIHVSDTGPGMTPDQTRRIFARFYRTDSAKDSENPGFGLGLAIAREIARHHGGDVRVESKPGAGSRFTVLLPLRSVSEKRKAVPR